jgi:hypothetical protein
MLACVALAGMAGASEVIGMGHLTIPTVRGQADLDVIAPGAITITVSGAIVASAYAPLTQYLETQLAMAPRLFAFVDASELQSFDSDTRDRFAAWARALPKPLVSHVLVRSKVIELGVTLINVLFRDKNIIAYTDRKKWLAAAKQLGFALESKATA